MPTWYWADGLKFGSNGERIIQGTGTPEGAVSAPVGSLYVRSDGGASSTLYIKESGAGTTGWTALGAGGGSSLTLEVNGTPNAVQSLLNLIPGTGVTLVDNGSGGVVVNSSAAGSPILGLPTPDNSTSFALITPLPPNTGVIDSEGLGDSGWGSVLQGATNNVQNTDDTDATHGPKARFSCEGTSTATGQYVILGSTSTKSSWGFTFMTHVDITTPNPNVNYVFGMIQPSSPGTPPLIGGSSSLSTSAVYVVFWFNPSVSANWQAVTCDGSGVTVVNTGVSASSRHLFRIDYYAGSQAKFQIDGATVATITTHLPGALVSLIPMGIVNPYVLGTIGEMAIEQMFWVSPPIAVSGSAVLLKTNGAPNSDQNALNLKAGTNITITPGSLGDVTIDASGGGSSVLLQTNGATNVTQNKLNLATGPDISISDDGSGDITLDSNVHPFIFQQWQAWVVDPSASNSTPTTINTAHGTNLLSTGSLVSAAGQPLYARWSSTGGAGTYAGIRWTWGAGGSPAMGYKTMRRWVWKFRVTDLVNTRYWAAVNGNNSVPFNSGLKTDTPASDIIGFRYSPNAGDTHWMVVCQTNSGASNIFDTGITPDLTRAHTLEVQYDGSSVVNFYYDRTFITNFATNLPPFTGTFMDSAIFADPMSGTGVVSIDFLGAYLEYATDV